MTLRPPEIEDFQQWTTLRRDSLSFLKKWEPARAPNHLTRHAFRNRITWARRSVEEGRALPLFLIERGSGTLLGAVTLDNIRRGPAQMGTIGYWIGETHARNGYMSEALHALLHHAFEIMDLSRLEAACLPDNTPSRSLLEGVGFKYEGVAQAFLQIDGRWRNHVLYACIRRDRRGPSDAG